MVKNRKVKIILKGGISIFFKLENALAMNKMSKSRI